MSTDRTAGARDATAEPRHPRRQPIDPDLVAAATHDGATVFVDFDHTLLACNSTELFIASCRPSLLVAVIEFLVRRCVPWRLCRLPNWFRVRDYFCCLAIVALCPGSIRQWQRLAPALLERHVSPVIADALRPLGVKQLVIITFGMEFVVRALLRDSVWSSVPLIATPTITRLVHFRRGKRMLATRYADEQTVANATFITDSLDDRDLLLAVRSGILIEPQGVPLQAIERLYMPLRYTAVAKYTRSYVIDQLVLVELLLMLIATSRNVQELISNCTFVPLLFLSVICIYEIGYFENDMNAARHERHPTLKDAAARFQLYPIAPGAWIWAVTAGALGNLLACLSWQTPYSNLLISVPVWISGLVVLRLVFHIYNKPDLRIRLHLYPVLQLFKFLAVMVFVSATPAGAVMILGQVATMWAIYLTYRHGGRTKDIERELLRLILIATGLVLLLTTGVVEWTFQLIALGVWAAARLGKAPILDLVRRRRAGQQAR